MLKNQTIAVVGAGHMAGAMIGGMIRSKLVPAKGLGRYTADLAVEALPDGALKGEATLGTVDVSTPEAGVPPPAGARQMDFLFANGALYRVRFAPDGPSALRAQVWWAVPGAPSRSFESVLTRLPPAKP